MPLFTNYTDQELLHHLNQGSDPAFCEIYDRHWEKMLDYAVRLTRSEDEGADIVQEIFVSIWNRRETLVIKGSLIAYLIKSTRNLSLKYIEKNLHKHHFLERLSESMRQTTSQFNDLISLKQLQYQIDGAIEKLPPKMRDVYILSRDEQLSHREIAKKLGIAETTVKKQINNALKIIAHSLKSDFPAASIALFLYFTR